MKTMILNQFKKMPGYLIPGVIIFIILGIIVFLSGIAEGSFAVSGIGLFFMGFSAWYFLTY